VSAHRCISDAPLARSEGRFMTHSGHSDFSWFGLERPSLSFRSWSRYRPKTDIDQAITDQQASPRGGFAWSACFGGRAEVRATSHRESIRDDQRRMRASVRASRMTPSVTEESMPPGARGQRSRRRPRF
jgi:hypothetical protein